MNIHVNGCIPYEILETEKPHEPTAGQPHLFSSEDELNESVAFSKSLQQKMDCAAMDGVRNIIGNIKEDVYGFGTATCGCIDSSNPPRKDFVAKQTSIVVDKHGKPVTKNTRTHKARIEQEQFQNQIFRHLLVGLFFALAIYWCEINRPADKIGFWIADKWFSEHCDPEILKHKLFRHDVIFYGASNTFQSTGTTNLMLNEITNRAITISRVNCATNFISGSQINDVVEIRINGFYEATWKTSNP